jgi:hypothetical protein
VDCSSGSLPLNLGFNVSAILQNAEITKHIIEDYLAAADRWSEISITIHFCGESESELPWDLAPVETPHLISASFYSSWWTEKGKALIASIIASAKQSKHFSVDCSDRPHIASVQFDHAAHLRLTHADGVCAPELYEILQHTMLEHCTAHLFVPEDEDPWGSGKAHVVLPELEHLAMSSVSIPSNF